MVPRLYSISTVCLLKHYNQDYLLHELRTDFTGSNGVGKSIIADLFQIVFVADTKNIKFATEGINKKNRKIESLPYDSGVGYVFFNIKVTEGTFLTIGAAIFNQGQQVVKPFLVTSSMDLKEKLEYQTFPSANLLYSSDFLKPNREPYMLDELSRIFPEKEGLYVHYFGSKEDRVEYYSWLYQNELLPINLVKEGNLKSYAKVIQSFSKSKALDIDSSRSLIEYLFEEDEVEIELEYRQQEQTIRKLLHQFKTTKEQINDITNKQVDLRQLKEYEEEKNVAAHKMDEATYIQAYQNNARKKKEADRLDTEIEQNSKKLMVLTEQSKELSLRVEGARNIAQREHKTFLDLASKQALFDKLEKLGKEERSLRDIDTEGLMILSKDFFQVSVTDLLEKDARYYHEKIQNSRSALERYGHFGTMKKKKEEQDAWLQDRLRTIDDKNKHLGSFLHTLKKVEKNNLFVQAWSINKNLSKAQQAALIHFRGVLLSRPEKANEGDRYAESIDLITDLKVTPDEGNKGWWLHLGNLREFVPETSMLLPDISTMDFDTIEQLKAYLESEMEGLNVQRLIYVSLQNGKMPDGFSEYNFDIDLSDTTKVNNHQLAAQLCAVVGYKLVDLDRQQEVERAAIEDAKQQYGITLKGVDYAELLEKIKRIYEDAQSNYESINEQLNETKIQITSIDSALPSIRENKLRVAKEQEEYQRIFNAKHSDYQSKYPDLPPVGIDSRSFSQQEIAQLENLYASSAASYVSDYNQIVGKYTETKDQRDIRVNEQIRNQNFNFGILEQALLGIKIRTLDEVADHLDNLNTQLLSITDELLVSLIRVFGRTEAYFDRYKDLVNSLNDFFRGKLISNRFYFRIDFEPAPKLNIQWIEHLRKSASSIANAKVSQELSPEQFIEDFYMKYSGNKSKVSIEDLLNPKRYFVLKGRLTDQNDKDIPGSTGESYTAVALLGIARLSVVQDGTRSGLRFIILEESATLDNVNFSLFPMIAKEYGYQIITMTPKPYAIGDDEGWFIHQLIPGQENLDINYPRTMSYFRTNKSQIELGEYLKARKN